MEIRKKVLWSSEFSTLAIDAETTKIQIVCDTLYIDANLSDDFRGKNVAVIANYANVVDACTWNLSGLPKGRILFKKICLQCINSTSYMLPQKHLPKRQAKMKMVRDWMEMTVWLGKMEEISSCSAKSLKMLHF